MSTFFKHFYDNSICRSLHCMIMRLMLLLLFSTRYSLFFLPMPAKINFNKNDTDSYSVEQSTLLRLSLWLLLLLLLAGSIQNIKKNCKHQWKNEAKSKRDMECRVYANANKIIKFIPSHAITFSISCAISSQLKWWYLLPTTLSLSHTKCVMFFLFLFFFSSSYVLQIECGVYC